MISLCTRPAPHPSPREPQAMGSQPRELQSNDISLYESLGLAFLEALFLNKILD